MFILFVKLSRDYVYSGLLEYAFLLNAFLLIAFLYQNCKVLLLIRLLIWLKYSWNLLMCTVLGLFDWFLSVFFNTVRHGFVTDLSSQASKACMYSYCYNVLSFSVIIGSQIPTPCQNRIKQKMPKLKIWDPFSF